MNPGTHAPLVKPATHAHRYALMEILELVVDSVHLVLFLQGLLAHSSTSALQLPPEYAALHAHLHVLAAVVCAVVESVQTAPLAHGELYVQRGRGRGFQHALKLGLWRDGCSCSLGVGTGL